jgi:hypothetical protein
LRQPLVYISFSEHSVTCFECFDGIACDKLLVNNQKLILGDQAYCLAMNLPVLNMTNPIFNKPPLFNIQFLSDRFSISDEANKLRSSRQSGDIQHYTVLRSNLSVK